MSYKYPWPIQAARPEPRGTNPEAYIFSQPAEREKAKDEAQQMLNRLGKLGPRSAPPLWGQNHVQFRTGIRAAIAETPSPAREVEVYTGRVGKVEGNYVVAELSTPDDMDSWDARLSVFSFDCVPEEGQAIRCTVTRIGGSVHTEVEVLDGAPPRELKDYGIDKEEWLEWAKRINV
jgi:hypothetical protein